MNSPDIVKTLKISARVTDEQKHEIRMRMDTSGYKNESEYILACCLKGNGIHIQSPYQFGRQKESNTSKLSFRVTSTEKESILRRYELSHVSTFSRFARNCCLDNPIINLEALKPFTKELHAIGNNLNQLTMLCHQGLITSPDIHETKEYLHQLYREISKLTASIKLKR